MTDPLDAYFQSLRFSSAAAQALWDRIRSTDDVWTRRTAGKSATAWRADQCLPISHFRLLATDSLAPPGGGTAAGEGRIFLSSGTSRGANLARSAFSREGLELYRAVSLRCFRDVLAAHFGVQGAELLRIPGVSLVPTTSEWPTSSLAQMIAWIAEFWPVRYAATGDSDNDGGEERLPGVEGTSTHSDESPPGWLFGTSLHFLHALSQGRPLTLKRGGLVLETGGNKGQAEATTSEELCGKLVHALGVAAERVGGEYGMCELASQAYRLPSAERIGARYRFPFWVDVGVFDGNQIAPSGTGALVVADAARIDIIGGVPIITEDIVSLTADGSFAVDGRIAVAPLKGCSLGVSPRGPTRRPTKTGGARMSANPPLAERNGGKPLPTSGDRLSRKPTSLRPDFARFAARTAAWTQLLASREYGELLALELGSAGCARAAIASLERALPKSPEAWHAACLRSGIAEATGRRWMIIAPSNHSLAALQPLALADAMGLEVILRISSRSPGVATTLAFVGEFLGCCAPDAAVAKSTIRLQRARIEGQDLSGLGGVVCFGHDLTVAAIRELVPPSVPVQAFGSVATLSIVDNFAAKTARQLVADAFALGQTGCLSSQAVFVVQSGAAPGAVAADDPLVTDEVQEFSRTLAREFASFWGEPMTTMKRLSVWSEAVRLAACPSAWVARCGADSPVFPIFTARDVPESIRTIRDHAAFVLPILIGRSWDDVERLLCLWEPGLARVSLSGGLAVVAGSSLRERGIDAIPLGSANDASWDGTHLGVPIFQNELGRRID